MLPVSEHRNIDEATETSEVTDFVRRYYAALERGEPLAGFYISDQEAGPLGPVVKIGSGQGEEFTGYAAVARAVNEVSAGFRGNQLESRALAVRRQGGLAWFSDLVWWSGEQAQADNAEGQKPVYQPFASLTRWTGLCLLASRGWRFLQVHVSEGI
jgi:hypothetical protein